MCMSRCGCRGWRVNRRKKCAGRGAGGAGGAFGFGVPRSRRLQGGDRRRVSRRAEVDLDVAAVARRRRRSSPPCAGAPGDGRTRGPLRPLRLVDTAEGELLYLDRYFRQEQTIRRVLDERPSGTRSPTSRRCGTGWTHCSGTRRDRRCAALPLRIVNGSPRRSPRHSGPRSWPAVPGPAKPTPSHGCSRCLRTARAGPANRRWPHRQVKLQPGCRRPCEAVRLTRPAGTAAMTLHRLLGWQRGSASRFRYNATNRLPYDVIVVDETSMVSLTMMAASSRPSAPMPGWCSSAIPISSPPSTRALFWPIWWPGR